MNDVILSLLITTVGAIAALFIRYSFYSKCDTVKCCCCELHRAVGQEKDTPENNNQPPNTPRGQEQKPFSAV